MKEGWAACAENARAVLVRRKPFLCLAAKLAPSRALLERGLQTVLATRFQRDATGRQRRITTRL